MDFSYKEFSLLEKKNKIRESEIPVGHYISWPMPIIEKNLKGFISFASPALRQPDQPMKIGTPDRWWILNADNGKLIVYALCTAMPYANYKFHEPFTLPKIQLSIQEIRQKQDSMAILMDSIVIDFFDQKPINLTTRNAILEIYKALIPGSLFSDYRVIAPQFFSWLDA